MEADKKDLSTIKAELLDWEKSHLVIGLSRRFFTRVIIFCGIVVFFAILVVLLGIYRLGWNGDFVRFVSTTLHIPAAIVNNKWILLSQYFDERTALEGFYAALPKDKRISHSVIADKAMSALVEREIVNQLADIYGVKVTDEEILFRTQSIFSDALDDKDILDSMLQETYGFTLDGYKHLVIEPMIRRENLREKILTDDRIEAESVDQLIEDFKKEYTIRVFVRQD